VASTGAVREPARTSISPPSEADATRNRNWSTPVRFVGSNDHQSPSSMDPMFWKPPAVSAVVSRRTPGSPAPAPSGARPVLAKYSACLRLGCNRSMARPVSGFAPPEPPPSV
jgi:hypothetical protein